MTSYFAPRNVETGNALALDMQSLFLSGRVLAFGARLNVTHVFRSSETCPTEVVYCFPLPRDASLVSFEISGEGFSITSGLEPRVDANKRYEEALEQGSLAVMTQQSLDGLVNLTVGNLRPGETVSVRLNLIAGVSVDDSGFRVRFPFTVAPCYHSLMRVSADRRNVGTIELPEDVAGGVFLPPFHKDALPLHKIGFELEVEPKEGIREIASPSHAVRVLLEGVSRVGVTLSPDRDVPNRDLVLDVKRNWGSGEAWSDRTSAMRKHFAVVVPSCVFGQPTTTARRVVFLLDRSGSMSGPTLNQALAAIEACLATLSRQDQFGIIAFDDRIELFRATIVAATYENLNEARAFLRRIDARGGTELASGVEAAARALAGRAGEILVITDGQVVDTIEILRRARKCEARLFCLGIGSASQDRFLHLLARQTGGVCRFVTPSERIDNAASELFAALGGALANDVRIGNANTQPASAGAVFSGTPFVAFGDISVKDDDVELQWVQSSSRVPFKPLDAGLEGLIEQLHGAKRIADLEAHHNRRDAATRQQLLELSRRYGLASSEMSLVAVVQRGDDQGADVPKTKIVPVGVPGDMSFSSYFGHRDVSFDACFGHQVTGQYMAGIDSEPPSLLFGRIMPEHSRSPIGKEGRRLSTPFHLADFVRARWLRPKSTLLAVLREAIETVENYSAFRGSKDANGQVESLLRRLVSVQDQADKEAQKAAITALIDFLSGDMLDLLEAGQLDLTKWAEVRKQLEAAWPDLRQKELTKARKS